MLLATDVAARGLDVPAVDHVVHYQSPRTADAYVHRNGRTARAARKGFSLLMVAPDERRVVRALMGSLQRSESLAVRVLEGRCADGVIEEDEIPEMPVELYMLDKLKARVALAREIDTAQHRVRREKHEKNWLKEAAEAMEIELDSDLEVWVVCLVHRSTVVADLCRCWAVGRSTRACRRRRSRRRRIRRSLG